MQIVYYMISKKLIIFSRFRILISKFSYGLLVKVLFERFKLIYYNKIERLVILTLKAYS